MIYYDKKINEFPVAIISQNVDEERPEHTEDNRPVFEIEGVKIAQGASASTTSISSSSSTVSSTSSTTILGKNIVI